MSESKHNPPVHSGAPRDLSHGLRSPVVVLTGAGVSKESGVPTFRDHGGLWKSFKVEDFATPEAFDRNPEQVWEWYAYRREKIAACRPNQAHAVIAQMEAAFPGEFTLVTQNIDGLHEAAGSQAPLNLHGSIWKVKCRTCSHKEINRDVPMTSSLPRCPACSDLLRPDVVWFGEVLPRDTLERAFAAAETSGTCVVVGTSALVQPAALIPVAAVRQGATLIEVNPEETSISSLAHERLVGPAAELLPAWWERHRPSGL